MSPNMHVWDRVLRIIAGVGALSFYGALEAPWRYITLLGLLLIASGLVGYCPVYPRLGIGKGPAGPRAS